MRRIKYSDIGAGVSIFKFAATMKRYRAFLLGITSFFGDPCADDTRELLPFCLFLCCLNFPVSLSLCLCFSQSLSLLLPVSASLCLLSLLLFVSASLCLCFSVSLSPVSLCLCACVCFSCLLFFFAALLQRGRSLQLTLLFHKIQQKQGNTKQTTAEWATHA